MLQSSLKIQVLLFLIFLCKNLFRRHAQVGARVEVDNSNVEHRGGPPLPEAVGASVCPRICIYYYLSRFPYYSNRPVYCSPYSICATAGFSSFLSRSSPGPLPLHCPTVDFWFVGDSARDEGPGSKGAPLLYGVIILCKNKENLWA